MSKKYLKPQVVCVELVSSPLMLTMSNETGNAGVGDGSAGDGTPDLVGINYNDWDNIWK